MRKALLSLLLALIIPPTLHAAEPEFSADMKMTAAGQAIPAKVYYSKKKVRFEMPQAVSITRMDQNATYILLPSQKTYMRQAIDPDSMAKIGAVSEGETERVSMGKESVNGIDTEKFKVTYAGKQGTVSAYQWLDKDQFPVKVEALDNSWSVEYSNMRPGAQPDGLFELPADFKEFQLPTIDLQGLMGGGGGAMPNMAGPAGGGGTLGNVDMDALEKMADELKAQYAGSED